MKRFPLILLLVLSACALSFNTTFDLQAEINAAPNGGTVYIPCGIFDIGTVNIQADEANRQWMKVVTIQGCGAGHLGHAAPYGQWDYLINAYPGSYALGTLLRGHITVGKSGVLFLRDVTMINYDGDGGIAVDYGDDFYMFTEGGLYNVSIGNYETGVRVRKSYSLTLDDVSIAGVGTGLNIQASNIVTLSDVNITTCTLGADLYGEIHWQSGSVQACNEGIRMKSNAASLGGLHFESIATTAIMWSGYGGQLSPNFYASNSGGVIITGYNNNIDAGWTNSLTLTSTSQGNIVTITGGNIIDNGWQNKIITRSQ